jgi:hypothetical protein
MRPEPGSAAAIGSVPIEAGMRTTSAATRSASCSNLSFGSPTFSFVWSTG